MSVPSVKQPAKLHGVILAAGPGTRHRALTNPDINRNARPKAMLPVGNRVLIDFSIEALKGLGLRKIYVSSGGPRQLSAQLENHVINSELYQADIQVHYEERLLDTAGTVNYLLGNFIDADPDDTICVLPCDTPHNIDLNPILHAHLQKQAAVTIAVLPIRWSSGEWKARTFGTVQMSVMPKIEKYKDRNKFEARIRKIAKEREGRSFKVTGYYEQEKRAQAQSNLINTGIYFFRAGFLMDLAPSITPKTVAHPFSDFGLHLFPFLGGRHKEFEQHKIEPNFLKNVLQEHYPFYAFLLPEETYWRDVGSPLALLQANMDVIDRRLAMAFDPTFWAKQKWGWQGNFGSVVHSDNCIAPGDLISLGSIVGNHVVIEKIAKINRSVVLDYNQVAGNVTASVCFPGSEKKGGFIGRGVKLANSIHCGSNLTYHGSARSFNNSIIYETVYGEIAYGRLI